MTTAHHGPPRGVEDAFIVDIKHGGGKLILMTYKQKTRDKMFAAFRAAGISDEVTNAVEDYIDASMDDLKDKLQNEIQDAATGGSGR